MPVGGILKHLLRTSFARPCVSRRNQIIRVSHTVRLCIYVENGVGNMTESHPYLTALMWIYKPSTQTFPLIYRAYTKEWCGFKSE